MLIPVDEDTSEIEYYVFNMSHIRCKFNNT